MMNDLSFEDSIDLALNGVFITTSKIYFDEKIRITHLKIGTELTVHSVIIRDDGVFADVMFSHGSWSDSVSCDACPRSASEPLNCIDQIESGNRCPGMTFEMQFDQLATKCRLANMDDLIPYIQSVEIIGTPH